MPVVCRNRPNRSKPRTYDPKSAARVVCATIDNGHTQAEIEHELTDRGCWSVSEADCEKKRAKAKAIALELIQGNNEILVVANALMAAWVVALRLMLGLLNALPGGRVVGKPAGLVVQAAGRFQNRLAARKAANDDLFKLVVGL